MNGSPQARWSAAYYAARLQQHGPTPAGVDWNGVESQHIRFLQILRILEGRSPEDAFSLLDHGCGYGALLPILRRRYPFATYIGYDVAGEMVDAARAAQGQDDRSRFTSDWDDVPEVDYCVASGVFHVRTEALRETWPDYVRHSLLEIHERTRIGWAANFLTSWSDADRMRPDLFYADPMAMFEWCKRSLARNVAVLHDYDLYEFTLLVRKQVWRAS